MWQNKALFDLLPFECHGLIDFKVEKIWSNLEPNGEKKQRHKGQVVDKFIGKNMSWPMNFK